MTLHQVKAGSVVARQGDQVSSTFFSGLSCFPNIAKAGSLVESCGAFPLVLAQHVRPERQGFTFLPASLTTSSSFSLQFYRKQLWTKLHYFISDKFFTISEAAT